MVIQAAIVTATQPRPGQVFPLLPPDTGLRFPYNGHQFRYTVCDNTIKSGTKWRPTEARLPDWRAVACGNANRCLRRHIPGTLSHVGIYCHIFRRSFPAYPEASGAGRDRKGHLLTDSTDAPADKPFPMKREPSRPFDPHPDYAQYRAQGGLPRVACPAGFDAYLVTDYRRAREVLANPTVSSIAASSFHTQRGHDVSKTLGPGNIIQLDGADHVRIRELLTPEFTVRRMRALREYIQKIINQHIDAMLAHGAGPVDFVAEFAVPIPALVICEMLGVPPKDRDDFQRWGTAMMDTDLTRDQQTGPGGEMLGYMARLCAIQMQQPDENTLIGRMIVRSGSSLTIEELTGVSVVLLVAGHETTANMISLSTLALLQDPEQLAQLRDDPSIAESAVEEMLRYLSVVHFGLLRRATEDFQLNGITIKAGDWIVNATSAANRDPEVFGPTADSIDLTRDAKTHLAFGFGVHQCLGQQLARIELAEMFKILFQRIETLRLAVPAEEIPLKEASFVYGVKSMPVTWEIR